MARDTGVSGLAGELAALHPRGNTFPGEVLLQVAADALEWCGASRADPLALEGMPERFLPECAFAAGKTRSYSSLSWQRALRGGTEPDLLGEVTWWQTDDFWSTPCGRRSPISALPPAGPTCRCGGYARNWRSAPDRSPDGTSLDAC